ncbi:MAG TPA: hypothetical protein VIK62_08690 [Verrucomicrobiae bacterium]
MKTFATIFILGAVFFVKSTSSAADAPRVSPSPIELLMDCGTAYSNRLTSNKFDSSVEFREATKITMEVAFRNVGEFFVFPETLTSGVSIVWDGKEYKQKQKQPNNSAGLGAAWPPKSCYHDYFSLSDFVVPPEELTSGRHTVAVRVNFLEANTFVLPDTGIPHVVSSNSKLTVLFIAQTNSNRQIYAESSALTIFIKTPK